MDLELVQHLQNGLELLNQYEQLTVLKRMKVIRRWWTKPHLMPPIRQMLEANHNLFLYYKLEDHKELYSFLGMSVDSFEELYRLTRPYQVKNRKKLKLAAVIH